MCPTVQWVRHLTDPVALQAICDRLGPGTIGVFFQLLDEPAEAMSGHAMPGAVPAVVLGGVIRSSAVSGGLRHDTIEGVTTVLPQGREAEIAYSGPWCAARGSSPEP